MRRRIGIVAVFALALLLGSLALAPAQVLNAVTPAFLQAKAWTFAAVQTFLSGVVISGGPLRVDGDSIDFFYGGVIADPAAPTLSAGPTSGGSCQSTQQYRIYVSGENLTGRTNLSAFATFQPSSGTTNKITVTVPVQPSNEVTWSAWVARSGDSFANIRGCGSVGAETKVPAGTLTFDCLCSTVQNPVEPSSNTTHDVTMLSAQTSNSKVSLTRPNINLVEVCPVGCAYQTVVAAVAAITTASETNQYVVYVHAPQIESSLINAKSYVSIIGESTDGVSLGQIVIPDAATGITLANLTTNEVHVLTNGTGGTMYVHGITCPPTTSICWDDSGGGMTIYAWGNNFRAITYGIGIGNGTVFYDYGNNIEVTHSGALSPGSACWFISSVVAIPNDGGTLISQGSTCTITVTSAETTDDLAALKMTLISQTNPGPTGNIVRMMSPVIRVRATNASFTARASCYHVGTALANSNASSLEVYGGDCEVSLAGAGGTAAGMTVLADADHANWSAYLQGGDISLSGGGTRRDIDTAETVAGFALSIDGVRTSGVYGGAGAGIITGSASHPGGKDYRFPLATAPATCAIGEHYFDTSGADCVCKSANTWEITNATGSCV